MVSSAVNDNLEACELPAGALLCKAEIVWRVLVRTVISLRFL